ncbi:hypothetical protein ACP6EK_03210 [Candidatus Caldatribacterium sp. SIUC1]|uniref:hypothetical protein n=1 Tax=Candidatus Caldatribacterium sp. SIUC1 TaxID=3418365 RepID=UPI003F69128B
MAPQVPGKPDRRLSLPLRNLSNPGDVNASLKPVRFHKERSVKAGIGSDDEDRSTESGGTLARSIIENPWTLESDGTSLKKFTG